MFPKKPDVSQCVIAKIIFYVSSRASNGSTLPWLHSTFKELSNDTSHTQIRVKTKKLWPRQVGHSFSSFYVATEKTGSRLSFSSFYVATEKTVSRHSFSSFYVAIEKTVSRQKNYVATEKTVLRQKRWKKPKKAKNGYFGLFSSPFHPKTINTCFFRFLGQRGR